MRTVLMAIALAGCAPVAEGNAAQDVAVKPGVAEFGTGRTCRAEALGEFVGQPATAELAARARDRAGASTVRRLEPGTITTMEFREDRLTIHLDAQNRVARLVCG